MAPHEERVVKEAEELEDKATKLEAFTDSETFNKLDEVDQTLLLAQLGAMSAYLGILSLRINRF